MRITRVFCENSLADRDFFELSGDAAQHLIKVMRLRCGQEFSAFDNSGAEYLCRVLETVKGRSLKAQVLEKSFPDTERNSMLRICIAVVKGDRFDWAVEKLTELGAGEIVPIITEYTQISEPSPERINRWKRLAAEACGQSGRVIVPNITEPISFLEALKKYSYQDRSLGRSVMFSPGFEPFASADKSGQYTIFIGPEGGFSKSEEELAEKFGCEKYGLGQRILRVETAAVAAAAQFL